MERAQHTGGVWRKALQQHRRRKLHWEELGFAETVGNRLADI
jgi:hypothetical protein